VLQLKAVGAVADATPAWPKTTRGATTIPVTAAAAMRSRRVSRSLHFEPGRTGAVPDSPSVIVIPPLVERFEGSAAREYRNLAEQMLV
jgi:hypothetical protein